MIILYIPVDSPGSSKIPSITLKADKSIKKLIEKVSLTKQHAMEDTILQLTALATKLEMLNPDKMEMFSKLLKKFMAQEEEISILEGSQLKRDKTDKQVENRKKYNKWYLFNPEDMLQVGMNRK